MLETTKKLKLVYITPALYMAGGVERVLTLKANYFAEHFGYDITIILTEGKDTPLFYPLSDKIKVINLEIGFEELWNCSFIVKVFVYLKKQRLFKKALTAELMRIRPDISISLLRREINFINDIPDGSKKIGELHLPRTYFRNFGEGIVGKLSSTLWRQSLIPKLRKLDAFILLADDAKKGWPELSNIIIIPNPLPGMELSKENVTEKRVIVVGRYSQEKGYDLLIKAWAIVEKECSEWRLDTYGEGDRYPYDKMIDELGINRKRCELHSRTNNVQDEYAKSAFAVCSSRFEGFGLVVLEALSCGLPVVSFDCPSGPRTFIENGKNGILVENRNVVKLANAILKLINDNYCRDAMAKQAKTNTPLYRMDDIAEKWKSLFEKLCQKDYNDATL